MKKTLAVLFVSLVALGGVACGRAAAQEAKAQEGITGAAIPKEKQTILGLHITAKEAYEKWQADPENVKILDVRTPEEYVFVGHPEMAWNVPLMFMTYAWDTEKKKPGMKRNPGFLAQVKKSLKPTDTILVTCRSGQRSKMACDLLAEAGYKNAYSIVDGFEGDAVKEPGSPDAGKRRLNGWKNAGIPWTYELDPQRMYLEKK
jgi:rhodanese-related sulfurtransferase